MLDDAAKALSQMLSPPLRAVLWKSIGLALGLIIVVAIAFDRLIIWLVGAGSAAVENGLGPHAHVPVTGIVWLISIAAGLGVVLGSVLLMPAVTAFVASFFADQIADEVERVHYPGDAPGLHMPLWLAVSRRRQDCAARGRSLCRCRAVPSLRRLRRRDLLSRHRLAARA